MLCFALLETVSHFRVPRAQATGNGNPIGALVYTTAFGNGTQQVKEWMKCVGVILALPTGD